MQMHTTLEKNLRHCLRIILHYVGTKYPSETLSRYLPLVILFVIVLRVAETDVAYVNRVL